MKGLAGNQGQRDFGLGQLHMQVRAAKIPVEQRDEPPGVDEFDPVVTAEMAVFVVKPAGIADRGGTRWNRLRADGRRRRVFR